MVIDCLFAPLGPRTFDSATLGHYLWQISFISVILSERCVSQGGLRLRVGRVDLSCCSGRRCRLEGRLEASFALRPRAFRQAPPIFSVRVKNYR